ncbi:L,D-transpeptidase [Rubellimicrobium thermophilum]
MVSPPLSLRGTDSRDWTAGCIAVSNREIEEIWDLVPNGVPVTIRP